MPGQQAASAHAARSYLKGLVRSVNRRVQGRAAVGADGSRQQHPPRGRVQAIHTSVLDGRTLNLCIALPMNVQFDDVLLGFVSETEERILPLEICSDGTGTQATGTVILALDSVATPENAFSVLGSVPVFKLPVGRWRLQLLATPPDGRRERFDVAAASTVERDGPMVPDPPCPVTGARFRMEATGDGRAVLKVLEPEPRAHTTSIELTWTRVVVSGRIVGQSKLRPGFTVAEMTCRGTGAVHREPVDLLKGRFSLVLPVARLVDSSPGLEQIWDVRLTDIGAALGTKSGLRVGNWLNDVRDPKAVFRTPHRLFIAEEDKTVRVHPYYTPAGSLAISCELIETDD